MSTDALIVEMRNVSRKYPFFSLQDLSLELAPGQIMGLVGPNGAGKSTTIRILMGLVRADCGEVRVFGHSMQTGQALAKKHVAVCGRPELLFLDEPTVGLDVPSRHAMWATIQDLLVSGRSIVLTTHYLEEAEALADRVVVLAKSRVIASGSVAEMRALVSRPEIKCESRVSAEEIRSWPSVTEVIRDEQKLHITAVDAEDIVRRLLAADPGLRCLEVRQAGLNEAFEKLTKEAA